MEKSTTLLYRPKSQAVLPPYSQYRDEQYATLWKYSRQGCDMECEAGMKAAVKKFMVWRKRYYYVKTSALPYTEEMPIDIAPALGNSEYDSCMWGMYGESVASQAYEKQANLGAEIA
jgi:hypothetical protein